VSKACRTQYLDKCAGLVGPSTVKSFIFLHQIRGLKLLTREYTLYRGSFELLQNWFDYTDKKNGWTLSSFVRRSCAKTNIRKGLEIIEENALIFSYI
jgi:hypothetical protein